VRIVRVGGACDFPCDVLLVAAMNPCPCGFLGDPRRACSCGASERLRYSRRLSGPLLDRIDLRVSMPPVPWKDVSDAPPGETSAAIRERVASARRLAAARRPDRPEFRNADMTAGEIARDAALDAAGRAPARVGDRSPHPVRSGDPPGASSGSDDRRSRRKSRDFRPPPVRGARSARPGAAVVLPVRSG
jgi:predicted ATPase with chaperone activity